jgi:pimeloyl-ACP methyl ester carboxylesterase
MNQRAILQIPELESRVSESVAERENSHGKTKHSRYQTTHQLPQVPRGRWKPVRPVSTKRTPVNPAQRGRNPWTKLLFHFTTVRSGRSCKAEETFGMTTSHAPLPAGPGRLFPFSGRFNLPVGGICWLLLVGLAAAMLNAQDRGVVFRQKTASPHGPVTRGRFRVPENRDGSEGRTLDLDFTILHANGQPRRADPLFFFAGGPGQAVTSIAAAWDRHWIRRNRDIVLVDQRGTAGNHDLSFQYQTTGNTLQQYLDPVLEPNLVRRNLERLQTRADLRMYSTPMAADDVNELREALGYQKINIAGGSYGTRICLVYLRRHGDTVRTAMLSGCAPLAFRNPLYHAEGAQRALDMIFAEAESSQRYRQAFGDLRGKFAEILARLDREPVTVEVINRSTGQTEPVQMDRQAFAAAVRLQMYYTDDSRQLPRLLCAAHSGDFRPFVVSALQQNIALRNSIALGMLLSVTAAEDLARIDPAEIEERTGNSFFGDARVHSQREAAALWPKSVLPEDFGNPVRSAVPTLILSGRLDPVTPPQWGQLIHENFPNSLHVVIPAAHNIGGPCVDQIRRQFLETASVRGLDTRCVADMKLPPLALPD